MRDIIWTIIIIWLVWKVYDAFKSVKQRNQAGNNHYQNYNKRREGEVKIEHNANSSKTHYKAEEAEYVDYEEVK